MSSKRPLSPEDEALATRYVLGELSEEEFADFEARYSADADFRDSYNAWAAALDEDTGAVSASTPLQRVKAHLDRWGVSDLLARLGVVPAVVGALVAALLVVIVTNLGLLEPGLQPPPAEAVLLSEAGTPVAQVELDDGERVLTLQFEGLEVAADRALELWVVVGDGVPLSLGLLQLDGGVARIDVPEDLMDAVRQGALVITLEPPGGAGGAGPTGAVVAAGAFAVP